MCTSQQLLILNEESGWEWNISILTLWYIKGILITQIYNNCDWLGQCYTSLQDLGSRHMYVYMGALQCKPTTFYQVTMGRHGQGLIRSVTLIKACRERSTLTLYCASRVLCSCVVMMHRYRHRWVTHWHCIAASCRPRGSPTTPVGLPWFLNAALASNSPGLHSCIVHSALKHYAALRG